MYTPCTQAVANHRPSAAMIARAKKPTTRDLRESR
jgi:hypothetical protein